MVQFGKLVGIFLFTLTVVFAFVYGRVDIGQPEWSLMLSTSWWISAVLFLVVLVAKAAIEEKRKEKSR